MGGGPSPQVGPKPLLSSQAVPRSVHWRGIKKYSYLLTLLPGNGRVPLNHAFLRNQDRFN